MMPRLSISFLKASFSTRNLFTSALKGDYVDCMKKQNSIKSTHCSGILGLTNPQSMDK